MTSSPRQSFAAASLGGAASSRAGGAGAKPPSLGQSFAAAVPPAAGGAGAEPPSLAIPVSASTPYTVLVGPALLPSLPARLAALNPPPKSIVLVSDSNVAPLHAAPVASALSAAGFAVHPFTFPAGEPSKTWTTLGTLLEFIAGARLTRSDLVLALGGGVVGDLAGFAAAVYRRGIRHVQLPTTLLAAVDSSVGGKTAVDLAAGKNQAGAFHQPSLVLCDTSLLATLPLREWACGSAEVVKYALLGSPSLFSALESLPPAGLAASPSLASVIAECVAMKAAIVSRDEFERGDRMLLNLGHTFGHAVELLSSYAIPHGEAVAIGLAAIARAAAEKGLCDPALPSRLVSLLEKLSLPSALPYPSADIARAALSDKKTTPASIPLVIPRAIGDCFIHPVPPSTLPSWLP